MPERAAQAAPQGHEELPGGYEVLDAGREAFEEGAYALALRQLLRGEAVEIGRDHNAIAYRVGLRVSEGWTRAAVVKVPRAGPQRTNPDMSFAWEAAILRSLPDAGIAAGPALLGRVAARGTHFLFMEEVPGRHPHPADQPLDAQRLRAILAQLYAMDAHGLMHYDLKAGNILVDGNTARFVDFEFARYRDPLETYAPGSDAFCADFNVSANPFFPGRSNVANFEFRALHFYLRDAAAAGADADALLRDWLRGKSACHARVAVFLDGLSGRAAADMARAGGIARSEVQARLRAAAAHEGLLAALFAAPRAAVLPVERLLMAYRCAVFERRAADAGVLRRELRAALASPPRDGAVLPPGYRDAVLRVLDLVGRSIAPGAD